MRKALIVAALLATAPVQAREALVPFWQTEAYIAAKGQIAALECMALVYHGNSTKKLLENEKLQKIVDESMERFFAYAYRIGDPSFTLGPAGRLNHHVVNNKDFRFGAIYQAVMSKMDQALDELVERSLGDKAYADRIRGDPDSWAEHRRIAANLEHRRRNCDLVVR